MPQLGLQTGVTTPSLSMGSATDHPITPITNNTVFTTAVNLWFTNNPSAMQTYGHIMNWDVSAVTSMMEAFKNRATFNDDISGWDVTNVTNMKRLFYGATAFNQDLSDWSTGNVTQMGGMFGSATTFNQNLSLWNVSSVTNHLNFDANTSAEWIAAHKPSFP